MNINKLQVTVEPHKYIGVGSPPVTRLLIKIERYPGEDLHLDKLIPDDDLYSLWDYIWASAGKELKKELEETWSIPS